MKVITYKFNYPKNTKEIPVPAELAVMGNFDVIFIKRETEQNERSKPKRKANPLLQGSVKIIDDSTPLDNDWELD
ncbi:hypothetical protein [Moraxella sp. ZY210820]|uniref:hypothetical protein n=1 Tax=unclassified Moraxella TaxID=2685852 RepID=UPI00272F19FA|nr:hypothetical protein [Moraxella sp. ZY210820]WLF84981.1 hypothetical protein LU301_05820 [Moraxella sp. ZY210820]